MADAITLASDLKIYHKYLDLGFTETVAQYLQMFNAGTRGAIVLNSDFAEGAYKYQSFFKEVSSLVTRRDLTSAADIDTLKMTQDEIVAVKLSRKAGPVRSAIGAFLRKGLSMQTISIMMGRQLAQAELQDKLNSALISVVASLDGTATLKHDATDGTVAHTDILTGISKRADRFADLVALVMHNKPFFDLVADGAANYKVDMIAGETLRNGFFGTAFGLPVFVTQDTALVNTAGISTSTDSYYTVGLVPGGVTISDAQPRVAAFEVVTGNEQILVDWQAEFDYTVEVAGMKWDVANGAENPTDAALATTTNWDQAATDTRNLAGVIVESR